jgi:hypothetical protein
MLTPRPAERRHVEDQHDAAIAQFGGTGYPVHTNQRIRDRFHHDLALTDDAIHDQADRRMAGANDDRVVARPGRRRK